MRDRVSSQFIETVRFRSVQRDCGSVHPSSAREARAGEGKKPPSPVSRSAGHGPTTGHLRKSPPRAVVESTTMNVIVLTVWAGFSHPFALPIWDSGPDLPDSRASRRAAVGRERARNSRCGTSAALNQLRGIAATACPAGFPVKIRVGETQFRKSRKNLHETPIDSLSLVRASRGRWRSWRQSPAARSTTRERLRGLISTA